MVDLFKQFLIYGSVVLVGYLAYKYTKQYPRMYPTIRFIIVCIIVYFYVSFFFPLLIATKPSL